MKTYVCRGNYGEVLNLTTSKEKHIAFKQTSTYATSGTRDIKSYKQLVYACMQSGTSLKLFNAAWKLSEVCTPHNFKLSDIELFLDAAKMDSDIVSGATADLVNDSSSKFYMYG
jgi:hypothetical protein